MTEGKKLFKMQIQKKTQKKCSGLDCNLEAQREPKFRKKPAIYRRRAKQEFEACKKVNFFWFLLRFDGILLRYK